MLNLIGLSRLRLDEIALLVAAALLMISPFILSVLSNIGRPLPAPARARSTGRK